MINGIVSGGSPIIYIKRLLFITIEEIYAMIVLNAERKEEANSPEKFPRMTNISCVPHGRKTKINIYEATFLFSTSESTLMGKIAQQTENLREIWQLLMF